MAENLTKRLVDLSGFGFASQGNAELCFDHVERGFDVRAFVIALHKPLRVETVKMKHLFPNGGVSAIRLSAIKRHTVRLEGNVGLCVMVYYCLQILSRQISLIRAHFLHYKILCSGFNEARKFRTIRFESVSHFNGGNDVGFHAAHEMTLNELSTLNQMWLGILRVHPLHKARSRKAGRV